MADLIPVFIVLLIVLIPLSIWAFSFYKRRLKYAKKTIVQPGVEYPNNHHVLGVGYYHAPAGQWFVHPWNEFRDDRGYYWEGEWHSQADIRPLLRSIPTTTEIERVNMAWRKASPDDMAIFWGRIERGGFGAAIDRDFAGVPRSGGS